MPIEETPLEQVVVAVALKFTGEPTVLLLVGEIMETPEPPPGWTVILTPAVVEPPQLSHSVMTVL